MNFCSEGRAPSSQGFLPTPICKQECVMCVTLWAEIRSLQVSSSSKLIPCGLLVLDLPQLHEFPLSKVVQ